MSNVEWDSQTVIGSRTRGGNKSLTANEAAKEKLTGGQVSTGKKDSGGRQNTGPADHQRIAKLDRENEVAPPETVDRELGKVISTARLSKEPSMTQKELGQKINELATVIQSYENGKAVPSPQVLAKMERALGVKLRGKDIGQPLGGPKKDKK